MHHWHIRTALSGLIVILSMPSSSLAHAPKLFSRIAAKRTGLTIPKSPPENVYRSEIEAAFADNDSLIHRTSLFHNNYALQALRQVEWLRHLRTTQELSPGFWDAWGFSFAEGAAGHLVDRLYPLTQEDAPLLHEKVAEYAGKLDMPKPMILLLDDPKLFNAFATGMRHRSGFVVIGRGFLNATSTHQLNGTIAHELGHIYHHHIPKTILLPLGIITVITAALLGSYALCKHKGVSSKIYGKFAFPSAILGVISIPIWQAWYSRYCERQADAVAGKINPEEGLKAMQAIDMYEEKVLDSELDRAKELIEHRYKEIDEDTTQDYVSMLTAFKEHMSGLREPSGLRKVFSTHPNTRDRINYFEELLDEQNDANEA